MPRPKNKAHEVAKQRGDMRFFDGKPCPAGHVAERLVAGSGCVVCSNERAKIYRKNRYATDVEYREHCMSDSRERHQLVGTTWYHENKERASQQNEMWRSVHHDMFTQYTIQWRRQNLDKLTKNSNFYRASKIKATPKWANAGIIQGFYTEAQRLTRSTGIKHAVDHVVPLNGKNVCGLHVEHNLQILTLSENCKKSNKHSYE